MGGIEAMSVDDLSEPTDFARPDVLLALYNEEFETLMQALDMASNAWSESEQIVDIQIRLWAQKMHKRAVELQARLLTDNVAGTA